MQPLHYVALTRVSATDERELQHRIELYHAHLHERREQRRAQRQRLARWVRTARARRSRRPARVTMVTAP